jgi:hypothetical protein
MYYHARHLVMLGLMLTEKEKKINEEKREESRN